MSIKNVGIGFVVILMLVLFALGQREPKDTAQNLPSLPSFYAADVVSVAIHHSEKTSLEAKKEGEKWLRVSAEKPMLFNALAIEQLLHDLQTMKVKRVASRKTEQFIRFSVNESEVILKDKQGKVLLDLFVGKPATDLMSTYIRVADDKLVMTVNKILTWQVKRTPDAWLDKKDVSSE